MSVNDDSDVPKTSKEILAADVIPYQVGDADICFWLKVIALQLALKREQP